MDLKKLYSNLNEMSNTDLAKILLFKIINEKCGISDDDIDISSEFIKINFNIMQKVECILMIRYGKVIIYAVGQLFNDPYIDEFINCNNELYIKMFKKKVLDLLDKILITHSIYIERLNNKDKVDKENKELLIKSILEE